MAQDYLDDLLAQGQGGDFLDDLAALESRPSNLERGIWHAGARTADIVDFLESGPMAFAMPGAYLGRKIGESLGVDYSESDQFRDSLRAAPATLPEAVGFGEKAADFGGSVAPDVALSIATAPVSAAAAGASGAKSLFMRMLAGEAAQSAALAPIEFGTRDPATAAIATVAGPVLGTVAGRGLSRLWGAIFPKVAAEAAPEVLKSMDEEGLLGQLVKNQAETPRTLAEEAAEIRARGPVQEPEIPRTSGFTPREVPPEPIDIPLAEPVERPLAEVAAEIRARRAMEIPPPEAPRAPHVWARPPVYDIPPAQVDEEIAKELIEPGIPLGTPVEEMTKLAPAKVNGELITAGSPKAAALNDEVRKKATNIVVSQEAAERAAKRSFPNWNPQKEQIFSDLTAKGVSAPQAHKVLTDPAVAGRLANSLRTGGNPELADALEALVGKPEVPGATTLKDLLSEMGPQATKVYSEVVDSLPESAAKKFIQDSEAGFVALGKPMTLRNLIDRGHFWRRGNLISGTKTFLGNITGNLLGTTMSVPRNLIASPLSAIGNKLMGRGPQRFAGEAAYNILGYAQSLGNGLRRLRGAEPAGAVGPATRRFAEMSRSIRSQIEGNDPFEEAGAIGQAVAAVPRTFFKGLGIVDQAFWDFGFTSNITAQAYRAARQSGAKDIPAAMKKYLAQVEADSLAAEAKAAVQSKELIPKLAKQRAAAEGTKMVKSAGALLEKARKSGRGVSAAEQTYRDAIAEADKLVKNFDLTDSEKEFVQRSVMRELMPESLADAQLLTERALGMAREGKMMDQIVTGLQTTPILKDIVATGVPFLRTPANFAREAVRTSPLGFITAPIKLAQAGGYAQMKEAGMPAAQAFTQALKNADDAGLTRMYDDLAQATYGTMLAGGTIGLLSTGVIKVNQRDPNMSKEERLALEAQGIPVDALQVGNFSVPLYRLSPIDRTIRSAAKFFDLYQQDPKLAEAAGGALYNEFVTNMADDVWLGGMQDLMEAATDENKLATVANKLGGSFVPRLANDITSTLSGERVSRKAEGNFLEEFARGAHQTAGVGKTDLGLFGKPREISPLFGLTGVSMKNDDPLLQELTNVRYFPPTRLPQIDLSKGESQDATQAKGFAQEQALKALIANPSYQNLPTTELKKKAMEKTIQRVGDRANSIIKARKARGMSLSYSDLLQALVGN